MFLLSSKVVKASGQPAIKVSFKDFETEEKYNQHFLNKFNEGLFSQA